MDSLVSSKRKPLSPEVGRLRSIKSKVEQNIMRQAADISARAHNKVRFHVCVPNLQHADVNCCRLCALRIQASQNILSQLTLNTSVRARARSVRPMCL